MSGTSRKDSELNVATNKTSKKRKQSTSEPTKSPETNNEKPKKRIRKYCPDGASYDLECEWKQCNFVSKNMDEYLKHVDEHLDVDEYDQIFECQWRDCNNEEFNCQFTFKRHVRYHAFHTKLKNIGTSVLKSLEENIDHQAGQKVPKCTLDDQTRNLIPELPFKFECSWSNCEYSADNPELFYRHIRIHVDEYPTKLKNSKCQWNDCKQIIKDKNRFVEHIRHHSQEKLVSCPVCGALFSSFTKFIDHSSRTCDLRCLCFQCSHCNKKFSTNNLLKEHIRKHINKTKCPICDMTCIDKNDLSKHILYKHTTHKAFKCDHCDHTCKTQNDLNKHVNLKHNERFDYQCDECEFKTKDVNSIKRHMLKFHMNNENVIDGEQFSSSYMCHVEGCNKVYCQGTTLSKHLKTTHNFQWPSGHSRFRYKLEADGFYRLQTLRYESIEIVELLNKNTTEAVETSSLVHNDLSMIPAENNEISFIAANSNDNINEINNINTLQTSNYSTDQTETNSLEPYVDLNQSLEPLNNKKGFGKFFYNGMTYFNTVEEVQEDNLEERDSDQQNSVAAVSLVNNNMNNVDSFAQLQTISTIQTSDNQNKLFGINSNRIDFDMQNFFTNASYSDKNETNMPLGYNNNTNDDGVSNGLNNFKMFSIDRFIDDSRF